MEPVEERRTFLAWAINGLGAIFAVILGFPIVCFLIDPRNRQGPAGDFKLVDGVRLDELSTARPIVQGALRDIRRDAFTLHPNDVLGRVWVVLQPNQQIPTGGTQRKTMGQATLKVFTAICPHLGCSVNLAGSGTSFVCPCHAATFERDGQRANLAHNPAQRGMDELAWELDPSDPDCNRLLVKYRNFKSSVADKIELS